ncbi:MAG: HEAT repeat domain-containing protein, partial [Acidimicrobiia bacterium]|nr:HEAT repeat domain-containing protein [Acidimicrobiia bacterium]
PGDRVDRTVDPEVFADDDLEERDRAQAEALSSGLAIPGLDRRVLRVPAGTVLLAHYDLFHRGSRVHGNPEPRYLYKFYAARVHPPHRRDDVEASPPPTSVRIRPTLAPIVAANRRWLRGTASDGDSSDGWAGVAPPPSRWEVDSLVRLLGHGREDERVAAAYRLGRAASEGGPSGAEALQGLESALTAESEGVRRAAGHGLRQAGAAGIPPLLRGLDHPSATTRRPAVAALGATAAASSPEAIAALLGVVADDPDDLVRSNAAYSLGQVARSAEVDVAPIVDALLARLAPGAEPDNAFGAELTRSTVRQSAAFGLLQALANHAVGHDQLDRIVAGPLQDPDRYVQGLIAEGLARTPDLPRATREALVRYLIGRRWNPSPRPG